LFSVLPTVSREGEIVVTPQPTKRKEETMTTRTPLGAFKPISEGSAFGKIARHVLDNPGATVEGTASALDLEEKTVRGHLVGARRSHGVDHAVDQETKAVSIVVPEGETLFRQPKPSVERTPRVPREPKPLGAFSPIRENSELGRLAKAIVAGEPIGDVAKAVARLKSARASHGVDYRFEDGVLSLVVPDGVELFAKAKEASQVRRSSKDTGKAPKPLAEFSPVRPNTIRSRICAVMDGRLTTREIADSVGLTPGNAHAHIYCLWRDCGMGFAFDGEGRVSLILPDGAPGYERSAAA
jgi:hypothetical protein